MSTRVVAADPRPAQPAEEKEASEGTAEQPADPVASRLRPQRRSVDTKSLNNRDPKPLKKREHSQPGRTILLLRVPVGLLTMPA